MFLLAYFFFRLARKIFRPAYFFFRFARKLVSPARKIIPLSMRKIFLASYSA